MADKPQYLTDEQLGIGKGDNEQAPKQYLKESDLGIEPPARGLKGWGQDIAATAVKGAIAVPEALVGLADIPTGGRVGKFLENEDGIVGFRPKQAREIVNDWHSDATKEAQRKFQEADGVVDKAATAIQNPSLIASAVGESLPLMFAGGVAARGLLAASRFGKGAALAGDAVKVAEAAEKSRKAAALAGAAGEGITMAGSSAEQIRQETADGLLTPAQAGAALATGVIGGGIGAFSGRLANKLGIGEAETMLAQGMRGVDADIAARVSAEGSKQAAKGVPRQVIEGAINEGLLEELPQSVAEQLLQNLALGKDWSDGLDEAIVLGTLSGGVMGAGAAGFRGLREGGLSRKQGDAGQGVNESPAQWNTELGASAPLANSAQPASDDPLRNAMHEAVNYETQPGAAKERVQGIDVPPKEFDTGSLEFAAGTGVVQRTDAPQRSFDTGSLALSPVTEEVQTPSQRLGLDPNAGALSAAAAVAVDSGATEKVQGDALAQAAAEIQDKKAGDKPLSRTAQVADPDTGEVPSRFANWTDEELHAQFRNAQAPSVRNELAQEIQLRRELDLQDELDQENALAEADNIPDNTFASINSITDEGLDGGAEPVTTKQTPQQPTTKGATDGAETPQAQQAEAQPAQAGRAQAGKLAEGLTNASATTENDGAQAAPVARPQAQAEGEAQPVKLVKATKADLDHLFGVDKKRAAAIEHVNSDKGAFFFSEQKAKDFVKNNGIADTHEVVQQNRAFHVKAKEQAAPAVQEAAKQPLTFESAKATADAARARSKAASDVMKQFDRLPNGFTPDAVKATPEWKAAKQESDAAFQAEREANSVVVKNFPKENRESIQSERELKAADKQDDAPRIANWENMTADQRRRAKLEQEIATGKTNNGGVLVGLRPSAIKKRQQELADMGERGRLQPVPEQGEGGRTVVGRNSDGATIYQREDVRREYETENATIREPKQIRVTRAGVMADEFFSRRDDFMTVDELAERDGAEGKAKKEAKPAPAATAGESEQFKSYSDWIEKNGAPPVGMREQIERDARLEDGEAERLLASAKQTASEKAEQDEINELRQRLLSEKHEVSEFSSATFDAWRREGLERGSIKGWTIFHDDISNTYKLARKFAIRNEAGGGYVRGEEITGAFASADEAKAWVKENPQLDRDRKTGLLINDEKEAKPAPAAKPPSADKTRAKADLMNALADLGDIMGKGTRMNIVPEQEQKLLPVLTRVLDAAFRLGYHKFKDAAKFSLDQIRQHIGKESADAITLDHLQGAYIAMAGGKQGVDTKRAVIDVESKAEIEAHEAAVAEDQDAADNDNKEAKSDERNEIQSTGTQTLEPVATRAGEVVEGSGRAGIDATDRGGKRTESGAGVDGAGLQGARSGGSGTERVHPPETRDGGGLRKPRRVAKSADKAAAEQAIGSDPDTRPEVAGEPASAPNVPAADFQITDETRLGQGGEVAKFNDNLAAIRTLKAIEEANRRATPEEQAVLARYVGWGGLANAFPDPLTGEYKSAWSARGKELRELLDDAEFAAARRSTRNAHYTSKPVVQAMWKAVERLGFKGGLTLETSMGVGNFLGLKPQGTPASFIGVEYDSLTSRIAQALYPQATVLHSGFQDVPLADNAFALSIGNPPFGSESLRFQYKPELAGVSIHNQFFRASMDALRPGGIQAMVVSRFLMDAKDKSTRLELAKQAKLIAAIRLPDTAFKENARTEVVTDIIILQKLDAGEQAAMSVAVEEYKKLKAGKKGADAQAAAMVPAWVETADMADPLGGEPMTVNAYFEKNKANIIGVMERSGSMQHGADITVRLDDPASMESLLAQAVERLPQNIQNFGADVLDATEKRHKSMSDALRIALSGKEVGHVQLNRDGVLERVVERETPEGGIEMGMQSITAASPWSDQLMLDADGHWYYNDVVKDAEGKPVKVVRGGKTTRNNLTERIVFKNEADVPEKFRLGKTGMERLQAAVALRDSLKRQIVLETADAAKGVMDANRKELAKRYDAFVEKFGPVNRSSNLSHLMTMPDGGLIAALEVSYQAEITAERAKKSGLKATPEKAVRAPILSERVVPKYEPATKADSASDALAITLSERGRVDVERIAQLRGLSVDEALSELQAGEKPLVFLDPENQQWETADAYLSGNVRRKLNAAKVARADANVSALEAVQPEAWGAEAVTVMLGSTWVPPKVYADFAEYLSGGKAKVQFSPVSNTFTLTVNGSTSTERDWSSEGASVDYILSRLMNSQPVVVTVKNEDGKSVRHEEFTKLAQLKAKEISAEFLDWVFKDGERRTALVDLFNEKFNTRVVRQRDGSHLKLPGKVPDSVINMRRHQKNVIWRGITDNSLLMDHAVGAGKTFAAIARAMERRRMGLSKKPMIVVPNHLVDQWEADIYRLYPGAKVLAAGKKDFEKQRRRRLFGKIATGDWDIVVVPHSSFGFIGIDAATEQRFLQMEMDQAVQAVKDAEEQAREDGIDNGRRKPFGVKEAERLIEKIQARMDKLNSGNKDRLLTFEQMGVDDLTVDEAHEFKNLYYSSRMTGVRGMGDKTGSRKANDLYNKVRALQENPASSVAFLTGTPISNSAVEMYTVMRYLAPKQLKDMGLEHFDAWRAQFVEASAAFEPTESGSLKEVTRLGRSWSNMRSLMDLYYEFTDAVSLEDIQRWYSEDNGGKPFPVPKVKGGDRKLVNVKPTAAQEEELKETIAGFDGLKDIQDPYERNAARLRLMDRARKLSLDVRAVDPRSSSDEAGGKLDRASQEIKRIYDQWSADRGAQMVFLDRSVPKAKGDDKVIKEYDALVAKRDEALAKDDTEGFQNAQDALDKFDANEISELRNAQAGGWNAYQQIKDNLIAMGVPANEIRFIQEANNDEQKQALFDAVNSGQVRVLIGSSQRMGAGTNAQKRLVGLHHIDVTWKPSDIEQREGRIIRQGNELLAQYGDGFEVEILAYATERTVDAKMWDLNATKLKTINGIRKYDGAFSMDFEDEDSVSMAEMAALASGNPLLLERVKTDSEINMLELQERAFRRRMYGAQDALQSAQRAISQNPKLIERAKAQEAVASRNLQDAKARKEARKVEIEGKEYDSLISAYAAAKEAIEVQQAGKANARYSVAVDGKRVSSKEAIDAAIGEALGDASLFEAEIGGRMVIQRTAAARELAARLNALTKGIVQKDSRTETVGSMMGFDLVLDSSAYSGYEGDTLVDSALSLVSKEGETVTSLPLSTVMVNQSYVTSNLTNATTQLFNSVERLEEGYGSKQLQRQLDRAKAELPELQSKVGQSFPKAEELAAKRERLRELVSLLDGSKAAPVEDSAETTGDAALNADEEGFGTRERTKAGAPTDRAVMDMVRDGKTAQDVLRLIAGTSRSKFNKQVARLLLKTGAAPSVHIVSDLGSKGGFKHLAKYSRKNHALSMTEAATGRAEQIFLHEMIHAATLMALDRKSLPSVQMRVLFNHVKKQGGAAGQYGMTNVGEFVSEAFTNPKFQQALRGMKAPAQSPLHSAWDYLVRTIKSILGLPHDSTDALSAALEIGVAVMRENMALRKKGVRSSGADANAGIEQINSVKTKNDADLANKGFVAWDVTNDPHIDEDGNEEAGDDYVLIEKVQVNKNYRGQGVARQLLRNAIREIQQEHPNLEIKLAAEAQDKDTDAGRLVEFYKSEGFEFDDSVPDSPFVLMYYAGKRYEADSIDADANAGSNFDPEDDDIAYFGAAEVRDIKTKAIDQLDRVLSHPGKVSLWDKTVGTMRHLAEREESFKPVFETAQGFIDDVSMLANDAADRAPRLLPRVEGLGDIFGRNRKKTISAQDSKAVAAPLFQGTLNWGRDLDGKPAQVSDLKEKYEGKSADDKAQMMLKTGQLDPEILKMWQGMQTEQYEKAIATRFENTFLKGGVVWKDAELVEHFKATPQQISLYREARAAIDRSIDMTARADMLRLLGEDYEHLRDVILDAPSLDQATALLLDTLEEDAKADFDSRDRLADLMHGVRQRQEKANDLMKAGYAPLSRFGRYTVDVVGANGKREYFGMFESIKESNAMFADMKKAFPNAEVKQGTISQEEFKLFAGVTPESLELFGNMLGLEGDGNEARDKAFQKYLQLTKNNHSALKRLIHRQGIAGYSEDVGRVLASFVYSNARQASGGLSAGKMERAISEIPKGKGELRDVAMGLRSYIQDPQEEGQAIRGMLFAQYLGGSVASAMVNMTQPFAVTMPYLSQFGGMTQSGAHLAKAFKDMATKGFKYETDLANAMQHAEDDGIVSPQEIHQLMGQARGAGGLRVGDGTKLGDAKATAANNWEKLKVLWGQPFALAEQFNRRSTFIAAFRIAKEQGMANPAEFARKAVLDTQFLFSKANKPKWARGAIGGTLFTFKSYSVSYLELLQRTWNAGAPGSPERKAGRRAVAWSMAMLMMMGGAGGLPFMEDLEDLIDGIAQMMGLNFSTKQKRQEFLREYLGKEASEFIENGMSGIPGAPIDVSGRLGMGNLIPGTGLLLTKQNRERDLLEVLGPAGDLVKRGFTGAGKALTGDIAGAAMEVSPTAVRNVAKGWDMGWSGMYKDAKGYKVIDTTLDEAIAKAAGFQPRSVAEIQEANSFMMRSKSFYSQTSGEIKAQWADAIFRKDDAALERVRERLAAWNRDNPDQPIVVKIPDIMKRVREMGKDRTQRIADTAPKALRAQMRDMAREASM